MASGDGKNGAEVVEEVEEEGPYVAPAMKTVEELKKLDENDESLQKMKQKLLPEAKPIEPDNPKNVLVRSLTLVSEGRSDVVLDLATADLSSLHFVIKEGTSYKLRISFHVQREIVSGLKYIQRIYRAGVPG